MHERIADLLLNHKDVPIVCGGQYIVGAELLEWTEEEQKEAGTVLHPRICLYTGSEPGENPN